MVTQVTINGIDARGMLGTITIKRSQQNISRIILTNLTTVTILPKLSSSLMVWELRIFMDK